MTETTETIEPFSVSQLEGATFHWLDTMKVAVKRNGGGEYDAPCILVDIKGYVVPIWVRLPMTDYESLRLLRMQVKDLRAITCTLTPAMKGEKYGKRIFAGAKDW